MQSLCKTITAWLRLGKDNGYSTTRYKTDTLLPALVLKVGIGCKSLGAELSYMNYSSITYTTQEDVILYIRGLLSVIQSHGQDC